MQSRRSSGLLCGLVLLACTSSGPSPGRRDGSVAGVYVPGNGDAPVGAPGPAINSGTTAGSGACAGKTLAEVLESAQTRWQQLAGITRLYDPDGDDGNFIYAFADGDRFAIVFKRGRGDCVEGCLTNEYWYVLTDDTCVPQLVGHYFADGESQACLRVEGSPMWGVPVSPRPEILCGA